MGDNVAFLAQSLDQLSVKTRTAVEWIEDNHHEDLVVIGTCKCHRAGNKTAYAFIQKLPDSIDIGCDKKKHNWDEIILVNELDRIGSNPKYRTSKKTLKSTIQWWKIHQIVTAIVPYNDPTPPALETSDVELPKGEVPENDSGSLSFAVTSSRGKKNTRSTHVNVATIVQFAIIALRVKYLGSGQIEKRIKKAWEEKNPLPLIQAIVPFIDLIPGFKWLTSWLEACGTEPLVVSLLVEVLKHTFAQEDSDTVVSSTIAGPSKTVALGPSSAGGARGASKVVFTKAFPKVGATPLLTDDTMKAAIAAFNKRLSLKGKGGKGC